MSRKLRRGVLEPLLDVSDTPGMKQPVGEPPRSPDGVSGCFWTVSELSQMTGSSRKPGKIAKNQEKFARECECMLVVLEREAHNLLNSGQQGHSTGVQWMSAQSISVAKYTYLESNG